MAISLDEKQYVEIVTKLAEIGSDVKSMHRRQDITNGRIAKNEENIISLERDNVSILEKLDQMKIRNDGFDEEEKVKKAEQSDDKKYWSRKIIERVLWGAVTVAGMLLVKAGIITISI